MRTAKTTSKIIMLDRDRRIKSPSFGPPSRILWAYSWILEVRKKLELPGDHRSTSSWQKVILRVYLVGSENVIYHWCGYCELVGYRYTVFVALYLELILLVIFDTGVLYSIIIKIDIDTWGSEYGYKEERRPQRCC